MKAENFSWHEICLLKERKGYEKEQLIQGEQKNDKKSQCNSNNNDIYVNNIAFSRSLLCS